MATSRTLVSTLQKLWKPPAVQRDEQDGSTPVRSREPGGETDGDQASGTRLLAAAGGGRREPGVTEMRSARTHTVRAPCTGQAPALVPLLLKKICLTGRETEVGVTETPAKAARLVSGGAGRHTRRLQPHGPSLDLQSEP